MTGVSTHIKEPDSQLKLKRRETDVKRLIVQAAAATYTSNVTENLLQ